MDGWTEGRKVISMPLHGPKLTSESWVELSRVGQLGPGVAISKILFDPNCITDCYRKVYP